MTGVSEAGTTDDVVETDLALVGTLATAVVVGLALVLTARAGATPLLDCRTVLVS